MVAYAQIGNPVVPRKILEGRSVCVKSGVKPQRDNKSEYPNAKCYAFDSSSTQASKQRNRYHTEQWQKNNY